mmetsp:Transcript_121316/g.288201  ORF Transcript_121316/g.288201 Transcript_121316/m.288201 type:complete len:327 (+) Transcript_121316:397-1377(+)
MKLVAEGRAKGHHLPGVCGGEDNPTAVREAGALADTLRGLLRSGDEDSLQPLERKRRTQSPRSHMLVASKRVLLQSGAVLVQQKQHAPSGQEAKAFPGPMQRRSWHVYLESHRSQLRRLQWVMLRHHLRVRRLLLMVAIKLQFACVDLKLVTQHKLPSVVAAGKGRRAKVLVGPVGLHPMQCRPVEHLARRHAGVVILGREEDKSRREEPGDQLCPGGQLNTLPGHAAAAALQVGVFRHELKGQRLLRQRGDLQSVEAAEAEPGLQLLYGRAEPLHIDDLAHLGHLPADLRRPAVDPADLLTGSIQVGGLQPSRTTLVPVGAAPRR